MPGHHLGGAGTYHPPRQDSEREVRHIPIHSSHLEGLARQRFDVHTVLAVERFHAGRAPQEVLHPAVAGYATRDHRIVSNAQQGRIRLVSFECFVQRQREDDADDAEQQVKTRAQRTERPGEHVAQSQDKGDRETQTRRQPGQPEFLFCGSFSAGRNGFDDVGVRRAPRRTPRRHDDDRRHAAQNRHDNPGVQRRLERRAQC